MIKISLADDLLRIVCVKKRRKVTTLNKVDPAQTKKPKQVYQNRERRVWKADKRVRRLKNLTIARRLSLTHTHTDKMNAGNFADNLVFK